MVSCPISLDVGRVHAVPSDIGWLQNLFMYTVHAPPMILYGLFIKPSNISLDIGWLAIIGNTT